MVIVTVACSFGERYLSTKLYEHLAAQFSISTRAQVVERKLNIIARSSEFILERLQDRTANLLEWAIIFLFVIDLVFIFLQLRG